MNNFWRDLYGSIKEPEFWALSSWLDIVVKYRKSSLGLLWVLMPSIVYVWGLGSFFASIQGKTLAHFSAHVAIGAMVFRTLMSSIIESATVFNGSRSFILDGHVRLTDYILEALAKSFFYFCAFIPATLVAVAIYPDLQLVGILWLPFAFVLTYVNALWVTVAFSLIGARFPDFGQLISNISIFIFLLTPIIWYPDNMPADSVRGQLMRFNPFYHFVTIFRAPLLGEKIEMMSFWYVGIMTVCGLSLATLLYRRYARYVPLWL